jgi:hypothetical protein
MINYQILNNTTTWTLIVNSQEYTYTKGNILFREDSVNDNLIIQGDLINSQYEIPFANITNPSASTLTDLLAYLEANNFFTAPSSGATTAAGVSYDNTSSGLVGTDVQAAIDELNTDITNIPPPLSPPIAVSDLSHGNEGDILQTVGNIPTWSSVILPTYFINPITAASGLAGTNISWSVLQQSHLSIYSIQQSLDNATWSQVGSAPFNASSLDYQVGISTPIGSVYFRIQAIASNGTTVIATSDSITYP